MRALVTGGTGFLGSHLARRLLAEGHQVHILGRDFSAVGDLLAAGAVPLQTDLRDAQTVAAACAGMDAVFHVGALPSAWGPPADFQAINVEGTRAVVDGCRRHGVGRLIHVSTPAVIFNGRDHVLADERTAPPRRFSSPYAASKWQAEVVVNAAARAGLPAVILRPKAIFGPGDRALLPRLVAAARANRLRQFGDGRNLVDLTYVENVVDALLLAQAAPAATGRTYFITNGEHVALWPLIRDVLAALGLPAQVRPLPVPFALAVAHLMEIRATFTGREPLLTRYSVGVLARTQTYDIRAAQRDLGYRPRVAVAEGLARTLGSLMGE